MGFVSPLKEIISATGSRIKPMRMRNSDPTRHNNISGAAEPVAADLVVLIEIVANELVGDIVSLRTATTAVK